MTLNAVTLLVWLTVKKMLTPKEIQSRIEKAAIENGHRLKDWVVVDTPDGGHDCHSMCLDCYETFSFRIYVKEQVLLGKVMQTWLLITGISQLQCKGGKH